MNALYRIAEEGEDEAVRVERVDQQLPLRHGGRAVETEEAHRLAALHARTPAVRRHLHLEHLILMSVSVGAPPRAVVVVVKYPSGAQRPPTSVPQAFWT